MKKRDRLIVKTPEDGSQFDWYIVVTDELTDTHFSLFIKQFKNRIAKQKKRWDTHKKCWFFHIDTMEFFLIFTKEKKIKVIYDTDPVLNRNERPTGRYF